MVEAMVQTKTKVCHQEKMTLSYRVYDDHRTAYLYVFICPPVDVFSLCSSNGPRIYTLLPLYP